MGDHNKVSLTGKETFQGMVIISANTPQMIKDVPVQHLTEKRKTSGFVKKGEIQLCSTLKEAAMGCY